MQLMSEWCLSRRGPATVAKGERVCTVGLSVMTQGSVSYWVSEKCVLTAPRVRVFGDVLDTHVENCAINNVATYLC